YISTSGSRTQLTDPMLFQQAIPPSEIEQFLDFSSNEGVLAGLSVEPVSSVSPNNIVVSTAAVNPVVAGFAEDGITSRSSSQRVVAIAAADAGRNGNSPVGLADHDGIV